MRWRAFRPGLLACWSRAASSGWRWSLSWLPSFDRFDLELWPFCLVNILITWAHGVNQPEVPIDRSACDQSASLVWDERPALPRRALAARCGKHGSVKTFTQ